MVSSVGTASGPVGRVSDETVQRAYAALCEFKGSIDSNWMADRGGDFEISNSAIAAMLSSACCSIEPRLAELMGEIVRCHGDAIDPAGSGSVQVVAVCGDDADPQLHAAMMRALLVIAFPTDRWNQMQADAPGADHDRWRAGDVITRDQRESLDRARTLLETYARRNWIELSDRPVSPQRGAQSPGCIPTLPTRKNALAVLFILTDADPEVVIAAKRLGGQIGPSRRGASAKTAQLAVKHLRKCGWRINSSGARGGGYRLDDSQRASALALLSPRRSPAR